MTEHESDSWLRWLNSKFSHGEALVRTRGALGLSGGIRLYGLDIRHGISWPTVDFCVFGADPHVPSLKYMPIFEMTQSGFKYYDDIHAFVENNQWMKPYAGCASREELVMRISVNGDDPDGLLQYEN